MIFDLEKPDKQNKVTNLPGSEAGGFEELKIAD
jgi:hypothetical protein